MSTTGGGRPCSICGSAQRIALERAILAGTSIRKCAITYGVSAQAITRHRDAHMSKSVAKAAERERQDVEEKHDDSLLAQVRDVKRKADAFMALAHRNGDTRTALAALAQSMKAIELEGKFEGRIAPTSINVLVTQEFRTIQVAILSALDDHPLAKMAVLRALEKIEG